MRKVQVVDPGDSEFLPGAVVDKFRFRRENERLRKDRKKNASGQTLLLGVTKASLSSESFISAASFQETTKVLTEAAIAGRKDQLVGLKENVILGHMVPTGTGFRDHYKTRVKKNIDFGEIGKGSSLTVAAIDAQMEALMSGDLDPLVSREANYLRTGTEPAKELSAVRPKKDELVPAERSDDEEEPPVDPFDAAMGSPSRSEE
jgi:hypothetical protein